MKFEVRIGSTEKARIVELERDAHRWRITLDGELLDADAIQIAPHLFSVLLDGRSHEVLVTPSANATLTLQTAHCEFSAEVFDPRVWRGKRHGAIEAQGPQQIVAPMPGKVIRLLAKAGDKVEAGQGLLVVEAMKMQNEVRSPKSGTIERVLVQEGQPVNAGQVLAWIG